MKKILSALLVMAMLLSLVIVAAVPVAAVDGDWTTYGPASQYADGFDGDPKSVAGYEYTDDGLHMIPGNWSDTTPWAHVQTNHKVDLKDGVYFQVRVDDFSFDAADQWFNINIWDSAMIEPPTAGFGTGVQNLIRANASGKVSSVQWFYDNFTGAGHVAMNAEKNTQTADGKILIDVIITWNGSTYAVDINGSMAPAAVVDYMNKKWGGADSEAYVGVCAQNNKKGGTVEMTITKFGTSVEDAATPLGDDSKEPENHSAEKAPIADPNTVPANEPAILMNGNKAESDLKSTPKPISNTTLTINDDYTLHVVAGGAAADTGTWYVKNEVSYDIKDFPVGIVLMKNFCTCGTDDGTCYALESAYVYMLTGDELAASEKNRVSELSMCYDSYKIGDDTYLYFYADMANDASFEATGRINGANYGLSGIDPSDPTSNSFDLIYMAWFRSVEEAEAYVQNTMKELGWKEETEPATTEPVEVTTEPVEVTTEPAETEVETNKTEQTTAPKSDETDKADEGGCGSVVGFGAIAIVATAAVAGMVSFKKKED